MGNITKHLGDVIKTSVGWLVPSAIIVENNTGQVYNGPTCRIPDNLLDRDCISIKIFPSTNELIITVKPREETK